MNYYKSENSVGISDDIWERYAQTKDIDIRNEILMQYLYIVTTNIKRTSSVIINQDDVEDITNHGILELINCIERYDYTRGIQFDTFASIRVRGSIIDFIRKKDWIPRDVRKRAKDLDEITNLMQNELGRRPSDAEVSMRIGKSESMIQQIRSEQLGFSVLAFEELITDQNQTMLEQFASSDAVHPADIAVEDEFKRELAKGIDDLDDNERMVISLHYYEELKLREIASVMELTPSRISQIHSKALDKLKNRLDSYLN